MAVKKWIYKNSLTDPSMACKILEGFANFFVFQGAKVRNTKKRKIDTNGLTRTQ